jgi:ribosome-binding factor A
MGDEKEQRATAAGLRSARAHLRQVIGHQVRMKTLPDLQFEEDVTIEAADRIERVIRKLHEAEG